MFNNTISVALQWMLQPERGHFTQTVVKNIACANFFNLQRKIGP
ncbi:Uncharacterised protein [Salmonella enterica subsp. enterica serovar Havana]|nr:Uncharacterised protein [Salmonella enterica subsp. enterica serovar Havana]